MSGFQVIKEKFGTKSSYKLINNKTGDFVSILPHLGGSVNQISFNFGGEQVEVLDGYISHEDAEKTLTSSFKGSNLSPFPNRLADGRYTFDGKVYELPVNFIGEKNAIHGLVFDKEFMVAGMDDGEDKCRLTLEYENATDPDGYPFRYKMKISYSLTAASNFECKTEITNTGNSAMPYGHGWHPYFKLGDTKIDQLNLKFNALKKFIVDGRMIPTGELVQFNAFNNLTLIGETKLDDCFQLPGLPPKAEFIISDKTGAASFTIWQESGTNKYNFLQVYTPPHRKSIALEPMTCAPDAFNNSRGLIIIRPEETLSLSWGVKKFSNN